MDELNIECGEGWRSLIEACHQELLAIDPTYEPTQIKEKFGSLRYYFQSNYGRDDQRILRMFAVINRYELESMRVCEVCGKEGEGVIRHGWLKTMCEEHAERTH
jgi:hypothetical protein